MAVAESSTGLVSEAETRITLNNVPWAGYQILLDSHIDQAGIRFFYDNGDLEIMTVGFAHEEPAKLLAQVVEVLGEEWDLVYRNIGSATFKRQELGKGFEPDCGYYIAKAPALRKQRKLEADTAPGPDLIIEVDITSSSLRRFQIYAGFGVPEIWRYDGERVRIHRLTRGRYTVAAESLSFPGVTDRDLTKWVSLPSAYEHKSAWLRTVRQWARDLKP